MPSKLSPQSCHLGHLQKCATISRGMGSLHFGYQVDVCDTGQGRIEIPMSFMIVWTEDARWTSVQSFLLCYSSCVAGCCCSCLVIPPTTLCRCMSDFFLVGVFPLFVSGFLSFFFVVFALFFPYVSFFLFCFCLSFATLFFTLMFSFSFCRCLFCLYSSLPLFPCFFALFLSSRRA